MRVLRFCVIEKRRTLRLCKFNRVPTQNREAESKLNVGQIYTGSWNTEPIGVFTLVTRGWAASEFLTRASKFNMTPTGAF